MLDDSTRRLGIATGVIALIFGLAIGAVCGTVSYYYIWLPNLTKWSTTTRGVLIGIFAFFSFIGMIVDIFYFAIFGFIGDVPNSTTDGLEKFAIVIGAICGGLLPGILWAIFSSNARYDKKSTTRSSSSYSTTSYSGGSTSSSRGSSGSSGTTRATPHKKSDAPKMKKFTKPGRPDEE